MGWGGQTFSLPHGAGRGVYLWLIDTDRMEIRMYHGLNYLLKDVRRKARDACAMHI